MPAFVEKLDEAAPARACRTPSGQQRFGQDGDNPERALAWLAGSAPAPRIAASDRLLLLRAAIPSLQPRLDTPAARREPGTTALPATC